MLVNLNFPMCAPGKSSEATGLPDKVSKLSFLAEFTGPTSDFSSQVTDVLLCTFVIENTEMKSLSHLATQGELT